MTLRVVSPAADRDADEIFAYIAKDNLDAAVRFRHVGRSLCEARADAGDGPRGRFRDPRLADVRFWPIHRFPELPRLYRADADGLFVIRVLHGARDAERQLGDR